MIVVVRGKELFLSGNLLICLYSCFDKFLSVQSRHNGILIYHHKTAAVDDDDNYEDNNNSYRINLYFDKDSLH